jgi:subtilisin family serine protease
VSRVKLAVALAAAVGVALVPTAHAVTFAPAVPAGAALAELAAADTALVGLWPGAAAERLVRAADGRRLSPRLGVWQLDGRAAARLLPRLQELGALRYAEPARRRDALVRFTDPLATPQLGYHLYAIGADAAEPPGPGFPVTILDSGVDLAHPDFAGRPNTVPLNAQSVDWNVEEEYHGTGVASTAAAAVNGVGAEGVYPQAAIRTYDLADLSDASVIAGITAAVAAGPSVINMSLGGPEPSRAESEAIALATGSGSLVVAAAGNELEQGNPALYPAGYPHVVTVGALSRAGGASVFSSTSAAIDLTAPGEELPLQHPTDPEAYALQSGTSFSAPIVSAAAAWIRTVRGAMNPIQLAGLLRATARDIDRPGFDEATGFGLLDIPAALAAPIPPVDPQEPNEDVSYVVAGGLFPRAKPLVSPRFAAALDATEDPHDVYRVAVPKGQRLTVKVTPTADVRVALFGPTARTVTGTRARLALSDRAGRAVESVTYTNRGRGSVVLYLHVRPAARASIANPQYTAALTRARVPASR